LISGGAEAAAIRPRSLCWDGTDLLKNRHLIQLDPPLGDPVVSDAKHEHLRVLDGQVCRPMTEIVPAMCSVRMHSRDSLLALHDYVVDHVLQIRVNAPKPGEEALGVLGPPRGLILRVIGVYSKGGSEQLIQDREIPLVDHLIEQPVDKVPTGLC